MPETRLVCLDETHAAAVIEEATRPGDTVHSAQYAEKHRPRWRCDVHAARSAAV